MEKQEAILNVSHYFEQTTKGTYRNTVCTKTARALKVSAQIVRQIRIRRESDKASNRGKHNNLININYLKLTLQQLKHPENPGFLRQISWRRKRFGQL